MALTAPIDQTLPADDAVAVSKNTVWRRFRRHRFTMAGAAVLLLLITVAAFAPFVAGTDPNAIDQVHWVGDPLPPCFQNAHLCGGHVLGTDESGRDMLARLIFGARISLAVGLFAVFIELVIGTLLGALAGFYGSRPIFSADTFRWFLDLPGVEKVSDALGDLWDSFTDMVEALPWIVRLPFEWIGNAMLFVKRTLTFDYTIMRITDVFLSIPLLPLLLTLTGIVAAMSTKASLDFKVIVLIIGFLSWPGVARLVRATYLSLREREYTEAARAIGNRDSRIIFRHLLPNAMAPLIVQATLDVANVIVLESALSFLGFGIQPPTASWGNMLANAESNLEIAWWAAVFPGLCILVTVLAINYIGDGLRDALDPNMR